jgi:molybdenum cofactor cytidylyltransferase
VEITLAAALRLQRQPVAIVGAGGKSAALFALARAFGDALVTTTTHLGTWQSQFSDQHWIESGGAILEKDASMGDELPPGVILITGPATPEDRLPGVSAADLALLHRLAQTHARPLLIEADGARQRPLKAPAEHEPAIPAFVEAVIVVAGLSALGQPLTDEWVHRPEIFSALAGIPLGSPITPVAIQNVLTHPAGGLKNIPPTARRICLLTQADTTERQSAANVLAPALLTHYQTVLVTSQPGPSVSEERERPENHIDGAALLPHRYDFPGSSPFPPGRGVGEMGRPTGSEQIRRIRYEPTAAILLAAGAATRYGQPKQLLDFDGEPLVRRVARTALAAGLSQVVVVTGANAESVEAALTDLPVVIARCEGWEEGQAASIRAGVQAVGRDARAPGSAIFMLADQPYVTPTLLRALAERHSQTLAPIVAPLVDGRRGNPVLFDQSTFPDLLALTGDVGGRALFSRYPIEWLPWLDATVLLDVDTPDDYRKLVAG